MENKLSENILTGLDGIIKVTGQLNQTHVLSRIQQKEQYKLSYEVIEISGEKNYFLIYITYEDGTINTYFLPIQFLGYQKIIFDVPFPVASLRFFIYGSIILKDTKLQSVLTNEITEEQKESLDKVGTNSDYWDRIIAVTSALGNILTDKLEGSINTALNSIAGSGGRMYWEDGKFICRDGKTDVESTMAMVLSPAGFMISDSKLDDGNWNWRTFGTGAGFTADEIIAGTLRAIAIEGVTITASTLTGGTIIGATIKGGSLNINEKFIVDSMGDVQMSGAITWGADNSPVKVKYSEDNKNWHYDFQFTDTFAKYSYDGGLTWTEGIKIRGTDGINGIPGQNGSNGQTYYTWIVYANDAFGNGLSLSSNGKQYIGIAYNKPSSTPELQASHYSFSKIQGENGLDGSEGLPGTNGADGKTYYTWIRYADDSNGNGISNVSTGKSYIGIAYNKETSLESEMPRDYIWTLFKGENGAPGINGTNGIDGNTYYTWIKYADDDRGNGMSDYPTSKSYIGIAYNKLSNDESNDPNHYAWSKFSGEDGLNGKDGIPGINGTDGATYYVWIKYADSPTSGMSDNPNGKLYMGVAYNKTTAIESANYEDYSWSKIKGETGQQGPPGQNGSDANIPSYIQSTKITGTTVESCTVKGTNLLGCTVKGSTIIGGNEATVYTLIDQQNPLAVMRQSGKVAELWGTTDGSSYLHLYDRTGNSKFFIKSGASATSITEIHDAGSTNMDCAGSMELTGYSGFKIRAWNRSDPYIEIYRSYMNVGHPSAETYIDGSTVYINSKVAGYSFSENDVRIMELEYENKQLGLKQSELEVKLMERGLL